MIYRTVNHCDATYEQYSAVKFSAEVPCPRIEVRDILARNIERIRLERGLSQEELAHRAEIDRTYISALERRVYAASIDVVGRIAKALNVERTALLVRPTARKAKKPPITP